MKTVVRLARVLAVLSLCLALSGFVFLALGPRTGRYRTLTVLTGSMKPAYPPGSVVMVVPIPIDDVAVGDVVTYRIPVDDRRVVTHRVVKVVEPGVIRTKGDANAARDPWTARLTGQRAWKVQASVPGAGYVLSALQDRMLRGVSMIVAPVLHRSSGCAASGATKPCPRRARAMRRFAVVSFALALLTGAQIAAATFADSDNASASYSSATLAPPTSPSAAAGTCVAVLGDAIRVNWTTTASTWADGYEIARSLVSGGPYVVVGTVSGRGTTTFTNSGLAYSTTFHYVVRATKGAWRSVDTAQVSRTTKNFLCL